ncbi:MAG TPA: tetratricopeptide repeat protein [Planctomycetota bacterium]|nr:tetratricopeptide repeat protein [Planctomycetota bacterium]
MSPSRRLSAACLVLCAAALAPAASARPQAPAEEQYQFVAGLSEKGLHELAAKEARAFLERYPRHAKASLARYRLASSLYELRRTEEALVEYRRLAALPAFEFAAEVLFRLGQCELAGGRHAEAAQAFERTLAAGKEYLVVPATFYLGEARFREGRHAEAQAAYESVLSAQEGRSDYAREASYGLAWCAFQLGNGEEALRRVERFRKRWPGDALEGELVFLSGEVRLAAGDFDAALEHYAAVREGPFADAALRGAAFALSRKGDHRASAQRFAELLQRFPEGRFAAEAALQLGVEELRAGEVRSSVRSLSAEALSESAEAAYWLAQAQAKAGEAEAALASLDRALSLRPEPQLAERVNAARGDLLGELGRPEEALRAYQRSGSDYASYAASVAALNSGRAEEAVRLAGGLLERSGDGAYSARARLVIAEGWFAQGRYGEAEPAFRAALEVAPDPASAARALSRLGWCRFLQGDPNAAGELFERLVREHPKASEACEGWFLLGRSREDAGDPRGAAQAWTRYLEGCPEGGQRAQARLGLARLDPGEAGSAQLQRLLGESPDGEHADTARFQLAERLSRAGRGAEAIPHYRALLERSPAGPHAAGARYGLGWCLYGQEAWDEAARVLEPLAGGGTPGDDLRVSALELCVWTHAKRSDGRASREAWRRFAALCPDEPRVLAAARIAAGALRSAGALEEAQGVYEMLLERTRDPAVAQAALVESAWLSLEGGEIDQAEASLRAARKIPSQPGSSAREAAALAEACFFAGEGRFEAGELSRAAELYALAQDGAEDGLLAKALYKQGFAHLRLGELEAAERAFAALVEGHRESELWGESLFLLGEARFRARRFAQAAEALERVGREAPRHEVAPKALFRLGLSLGELGRWKECSAALAELARRAPEFEGLAEAELWRGRALFEQRDLRGARAAFERSVGLDRGAIAARARLGLGRLALAGGDVEQALAEFLKVAVLYAADEEVAEALVEAGGCLERLGDRDRARARYREVLEGHASARAAGAARERLRALGEE